VESNVEDGLLAAELLEESAGDQVLLENGDPSSRLSHQYRIDEPRDAGSDDDDVSVRHALPVLMMAY
jgi:hypothetical protein